MTIYKEYLEYMTMQDIINKFSFYDSVVTMQGTDYMFCVPVEGKNYTPCLLHTQLTDGLPSTNAGAAIIDDIMSYNHEQPPFILITTGKFGVKNFLANGLFNPYVDTVNVIVSINGNKCYAYEHADNLPQEIVDILPPWSSRSPFTEHGLLNQLLSATFDIPSICIHTNALNPFNYTDELFDAATTDVVALLNQCTISFKEYVHTPVPPPGPLGTGTASKEKPYYYNKACGMCGKQRPTTYYYRVHQHLCKNCANRVKSYGTINLVNHTKALMQLEHQRKMTRIANSMRKYKVCPRCADTHVAWMDDGNEYIGSCPKCSALIYNINNRVFFVYLDSVFEFSKGKLLSIMPIDNNPYIKTCSTCGAIVSKFNTNMVGDIEHVTCLDCERINNEHKY